MRMKQDEDEEPTNLKRDIKEAGRRCFSAIEAEGKARAGKDIIEDYVDVMELTEGKTKDGVDVVTEQYGETPIVEPTILEPPLDPPPVESPTIEPGHSSSGRNSKTKRPNGTTPSGTTASKAHQFQWTLSKL